MDKFVQYAGLLVVCFLILMFAGFSSCPRDVNDQNVLFVGEELQKESLPLKMGSRLYKLRVLKPHSLYEVKISYPASIPSSFSLQLERGSSDLRMNQGRKLLNTEKLIFKTEGIDVLNDQGGMYVVVRVEPEGVDAIPGHKEREYVIFNIVCDELLMGVPHKAWYVVLLVLLCLGVAFVIPSFLAPLLLPNKKSPQLTNLAVSKDSYINSRF